MTLYLSNRDGDGKTNEEGHYRMLARILEGNVLHSGDLTVTANSPLGMSVLITPGDYRIPVPSGYAYMGWNNGNEEVTISTANPSNPRITAIVMYVDKGESTAPTPPNNPEVTKAMAVAGVAAGSPVAPSDTVIQAAVGAGNPFIRLANVIVNAGVTQITSDKITDTRERMKITEDLRDASNIITYVGEVLYPIGSIYENATNSANPATLFGFGTWTEYGQGRVTVARDAGTFSVLGGQGGEESHVLTIDELARHDHNYSRPLRVTDTDRGGNSSSWSLDSVQTLSTSDTGNNQPHNNLQPYIVVYRWRRVA